MSRKERERKAIMSLYQENHMTLAAAAKRMNISYRQACRIWKRFKQQGDTGLVHKSRARPSNRRLSAPFTQHVLTYYQERLLGFEPTFSSEKLAQAGLSIKPETLRRLLIREGLWKPKIKRAKHRARRQRRSSFGELVQLDGSFHDWFSNGTQYCLMNMVDDSSSVTLAQLHDEETTAAAMHVLWAWIEKYGIPKALYTDKKNVYVTDREPTVEEQLAGIEPLTAFGKCCQDLGIDIIAAHSPQAKGRVERSNGTYQNRFVKELQFRGIDSLEQANDYLRADFCDDLNRRFALKDIADAHRPIGDTHLYDIFVWQVTRVVSNDWTIRYENQHYQLSENGYQRLKPKAKVQVVMHLDGKIRIRMKGESLEFKAIDAPVRLKDKPKLSESALSEMRAESGRKGAKCSPWRQYNPDWLKHRSDVCKPLQ